MEIKYEPVFGDQALFDGMMDSCEFASEEYGYIFANGVLYYCERYNEKAGWALSCKSHLTFKPSAMRRIIRTPIWTVEDQKAGKLPEVGAKLIYTETRDAFEFVGVIAGSMRWACKDFQDGFLYFFEQSEMSPIETPAEKAQRERDEWIDNACSFICFYDICRVDAIKSLEITYDKLKSGELSMPGKE